MSIMSFAIFFNNILQKIRDYKNSESLQVQIWIKKLEFVENRERQNSGNIILSDCFTETYDEQFTEIADNKTITIS